MSAKWVVVWAGMRAGLWSGDNTTEASCWEISGPFHCKNIDIFTPMQMFTKWLGYNPGSCSLLSTSPRLSKSEPPSSVTTFASGSDALSRCPHCASAAPQNLLLAMLPGMGDVVGPTPSFCLMHKPRRARGQTRQWATMDQRRTGAEQFRGEFPLGLPDVLGGIAPTMPSFLSHPSYASPSVPWITSQNTLPINNPLSRLIFMEESRLQWSPNFLHLSLLTFYNLSYSSQNRSSKILMY